ncbi:DUF3368 domain-containing protein [Leptolyngbya boryana CZ1]|uniref:DUF3368 domain-containing protein n=1 Tax=Leptolyngbya boryana CZ1 TaxID=3060204 RepID=A0AA97AVL2_LEPBY|nr:DUF3368 domain-containing protein [Leptolyngbya boryana]WNZ47500.1 DUF3368 domain-containing protein [Leptolyngbya boryana CZ1]
MIIVSNTTPLSELAKIDRLDLLSSLFTKILIPPTVHAELTTGNHLAKLLIPNATWIEIRPLQQTERIEQLLKTPGLDRGECAAIALAEELQADRLLMDERAGRNLAQTLGLPIIGTIGILLLAREQRIISEVSPLLNGLIDQGTWISPAFYQQVLQMAGEE